MSHIRLRNLIEVNPPTPKFESSTGDLPVTFLPLEAVWNDDRLDLSMTRPKAEVNSGYTRFQDYDVLLPKVAPTFHAGRSCTVSGLTNGIGAGSTELHVLRARPASTPQFVKYVTQIAEFLERGAASLRGVAGLQRLPELFVKDFSVCDWSRAEQIRIAAFLDDQTLLLREATIDRRRQIELEREKYEAERERIIEAGADLAPLNVFIDPVRPINYGVLMPGPSTPGGVPLIEAGDVMRGPINVERLRRTAHEIEVDFSRSRLREHDLVMAIRGSTGKVEIVPKLDEIANVTRDAARISVNPLRGDSNYLRHAMLTRRAQEWLELRLTGSAVKGINIADLRKLPVRVRGIQGQRSVAKELDDLERDAKDTIEAMRKSLELLGERNRALITSAITGEFDVSTARSGT